MSDGYDLVESVVRVAEMCERAEAAGTPQERSDAAKQAATAIAEVTGRLAQISDTLALSLADSDMSLAQIGEALGVSRQRAHQRVSRARDRRQAEWGTVAPIRATPDPRTAFEAYCEAAYLAAESACRGYLVTRQGERQGIDGRGFYLAHGRRLAVRWASEELREHWATAGRPLAWSAWRSQTSDRRDVA
jgi:hypothetical protein